MENVEIARTFDEVADLLEIKGANPFRVRAYRNAARFIESFDRPMKELVAQEKDLTELETIGEDIAEYIEEMVKTGTLQSLRDLEKEVPPTLAEFTRVPGLGPKRAKQIWEELDITTIEQLEKAARAGDIAKLEGLGEKTQQKILEGLQKREDWGKRFLLSEADQFVEPLLEYMKEAPGIDKLEVAGSYRRRKETVGDIDLLATADERQPVMDYFTDWDQIADVVGSGETKATVILRSGLQVDLRIVEPKAFGAALVYFTGSKAHNIKLRRMAIDRGLRISEYGVFEVGDDAEDVAPGEGKFVAGETEEDVYDSVDVRWFPPEMREDRGEFDLDELPDLIELDDIRGDLQMHTEWSDGRNTIEEMVEACIARGYEYMAITDHSPKLAMTGVSEEELREQFEEIDEVAASHDDIRIFRSLEVDIHEDGSLDLSDELLEELDLVLVTVHSHFDLSSSEQTKRIIKALEHPAVHIFGHPTARRLQERSPIDFDIDEVLKCAGENDVAVELDADPERLDLSDTNLMRAREVGVKIIIDTDAHSTQTLDNMRYGIDQARRAWLTAEDVVNTLPLEKFMKAMGIK
jgi:DNA polymerase (family 10)